MIRVRLPIRRTSLIKRMLFAFVTITLMAQSVAAQNKTNATATNSTNITNVTAVPTFYNITKGPTTLAPTTFGPSSTGNPTTDQGAGNGTATNSTTLSPSNATTIPVSTIQPSDPVSDPITIPPTTEKPTGSPISTPPPTLEPSTVPPTTASPTKAKDTSSPTSLPTPVPSPSPTDPSSPFSATVEIVAKFQGVGQLSTEDTDAFEQTTAAWFDEYYNKESDSRRKLSQLRQQQRILVVGVSDMQSSATVNFQSFSNVSPLSNTVYYTQTLSYVATEDAPDAPALALKPYEDDKANDALATKLKENIAAFANLETPIATPVIGEAPNPVEDKKVDEGGLSIAAIAGIAAGGGVFCLILAFLAYRALRKDDNAGYADTGSLPPSQFNINAADEVSAIDDPTVAKMGSGDVSIGGQDQSVATMDYDYSKAYGGGDTSVVSSAGGTLGDTTRQTASDLQTQAARAALGANFDADPQSEFREQIMVVDAPAGKLGVVIDTPDDGAPVVHAVKDSSVIADKIQVGDKLIAVDDEDVRQMTAIKVSKLISKKSANPSRKLTIVRTVHVDH